MAKLSTDKKITLIADYLFANPGTNRADILAEFGKKWHVSERTIDRLIKTAKEHNSKKIEIEENTKCKVIAEGARTSTDNGILSRNEIGLLLSDIAKGDKCKIIDKKTGKEIEISTVKHCDRIKAAQQLCKMYGYDEPSRHQVRFDPTNLSDDELKEMIREYEE